MTSKPMSVWVACGFSTALSVIAVVGNLAGLIAYGKSDAGMIPFLCFLPMAFYFTAEAQRQTRDYVTALETRVRELEADKVSAPSL